MLLSKIKTHDIYYPMNSSVPSLIDSFARIALLAVLILLPATHSQAESEERVSKRRGNIESIGLVMGGTTAGSVTAGTLSGTVSNFSLNWLSGSLMTFRLTDIATWAETEWTANRMFFNGQSGSALNLTWAQVIDPTIGFNSGGGTYFDWNGTSRILGLVTIPEPSTGALFAASLAAVLIARRRRRTA
jgi:hypothetical protein